jgi:TM2 domain-containing membrane protein YozV
MKQSNEKFCSSCGEIINIKAVICPKCGVEQADQVKAINNELNEQRNKFILTLLLCWFLGVLGIHRFYTGHTGIGIAQLLTLGGCGIWALIDLIIIATGNYKDAQGNEIKY